MSKAPLKSLADLKAVQREIAGRRAREAAEAEARAAAAKRAEAASNLFQRAVGAVVPLPPKGRVELPRTPVPPEPVQQRLDDERVLREALSDDFDASTLLDVDDALSFRCPGVGTDVTKKLRAGHWSLQAEIDLHGLRTDEAREALGAFVRDAHKRGLRCVRVVHGKGLGSPGKAPVLKGKVQAWLIQKAQVMAFVQARGPEGGAGALVVLLVPGNQGKNSL